MLGMEIWSEVEDRPMLVCKCDVPEGWAAARPPGALEGNLLGSLHCVDNLGRGWTAPHFRQTISGGLSKCKGTRK